MTRQIKLYFEDIQTVSFVVSNIFTGEGGNTLDDPDWDLPTRIFELETNADLRKIEDQIKRNHLTTIFAYLVVASMIAAVMFTEVFPPSSLIIKAMFLKALLLAFTLNNTEA